MIKYSSKLMYVEQKENNQYRTIFRNSDNTFDIKESDELFMDLFDIPTFKQAIQGCKIDISLKAYNGFAIKMSNKNSDFKMHKLEKIKKDFTTKLINVMSELDFDNVEKEEVPNLINMIDEVNNLN